MEYFQKFILVANLYRVFTWKIIILLLLYCFVIVVVIAVYCSDPFFEVCWSLEFEQTKNISNR